jgi:phosphate-selective porin OprO/OprP
LAVTLLPSGPLFAQEPDTSPAARTPAPAESNVTFGWADHPRIRVGTRLRVDVRARLQGDVLRSEAPLDDEDALDTDIDLAKRRAGIDGEYQGVLAFQVERDFADDDNPWRDVYADYRQFTAVRVQAGKFKMPFSLDANTSAADLDFVYRSLAATRLAPGRDWGVMMHGRMARRAFQYEVGVFRHDGDRARVRNDTQVAAGRTVALRFATEPAARSKTLGRTFSAAVALTTSDVAATPFTLRARTALGSPFLLEDAWVQGARRRIGLEALWMPGPASIKAEYMRVSQARRGQSLEEADLEALAAAGWYASGTWIVTGDSKSDVATPGRPLFQGGIGAIEVGARIEALTFGNGGARGSISPRAEEPLGNRNRVTTIGVNWYVNQWVKVQANAIHEALEDPLQGPLPSQTSFWSGAFRLQLSI